MLKISLLHAPDHSILTSKLNIISLPWEGPPPARSLRSLAFVTFPLVCPPHMRWPTVRHCIQSGFHVLKYHFYVWNHSLPGPEGRNIRKYDEHLWTGLFHNLGPNAWPLSAHAQIVTPNWFIAPHYDPYNNFFVHILLNSGDELCSTRYHNFILWCVPY